MNGFFRSIVKHKKAVVVIFLVASVVCACLIPLVKTNYNMVDYLPEQAQSTTAVRIMEDEFSSDIPNASVLVHKVSIAEALAIKDEIAQVEGVESVMWLDDVIDIAKPLEMADEKTVETYYRADVSGEESASSAAGGSSGDANLGTALFQVCVADGK